MSTKCPSAKPPTEGVADRLVFREVTPARWDDFEKLFESPGAPKYCWCMVWRNTPEEAKRTDSTSKKTFMQARIKRRTPVGILGYLDGEPVAWCSIAPRETYNRSLGGQDDDASPGPPQRADLSFREVRTKDASPPLKVWSMVCFYVPRKMRRQGIMTRLLQAAIDHASRKGADVVEAYPVLPDSPSYRFGGYVPAFKAAGFSPAGMAGSRRHVMRLAVKNASKKPDVGKAKNPSRDKGE